MMTSFNFCSFSLLSVASFAWNWKHQWTGTSAFYKLVADIRVGNDSNQPTNQPTHNTPTFLCLFFVLFYYLYFFLSIRYHTRNIEIRGKKRTQTNFYFNQFVKTLNWNSVAKEFQLTNLSSDNQKKEAQFYFLTFKTWKTIFSSTTYTNYMKWLESKCKQWLLFLFISISIRNKHLSFGNAF